VVRPLSVDGLPDSGTVSGRLPIREPVREYGRGVCEGCGRVVVDALRLFLFGVVVELRPGGLPPRVLCDSVRPGVGARLGGCFLNGDSGLAMDGRLGLNIGLMGRAPGPTDCENLSVTAGVGGVRALLPFVLWPFSVL